MTTEQVQYVRRTLMGVLDEVAGIFGEVGGTDAEGPLEVVMERLEEVLASLDEEGGHTVD